MEENEVEYSLISAVAVHVSVLNNVLLGSAAFAGTETGLDIGLA